MTASHSRWVGWILPGILLSLLLAACASVGPAVVEPQRSPSDTRDYRLLTLENNMEVLLVSDPNTPKAAAALDVHVGSADNPGDRAGLAHFLEHMLFLGTDKYPDAAAYEQFVTEHGGNRNAFTAFEHTNYFFDIDAPFLEGALDRFAQFFVAPRFDAEYVEREKNAVEAEYQMGLNSDARRGLDVLQELINPQHPYSLFTVGSLESLADRPGKTVRDDLLEFYQRYYSADRMRLVVLGRESLDELQAMAVPMFSPVEDGSLRRGAIDVPLFDEAELPLYVQIKPRATSSELQVLFPVGDYRDEYRSKPLAYLSNLAGHEGEGSLLSQLKAEGLAETLSAGEALAWRGGSLFSIGVTLTERGVRESDRVLQLLFAYLDMLRDEGPRQRIYDEQAELANLAFQFKDKTTPINYVSQLANGMQYYKPADVLSGPFIMEDYRPDLLASLLDRLSPSNAVVILQDSSVSTDRESSHYGTPYSVQKLSGEVPPAWRGDVAPGLFGLPAPNEFIAEDVSLVPVEADNPAVPERVFTAPRREIWFAQDEQFRMPRGSMYINFRSPLVSEGPQAAASAALYAALLSDRVNEFAYPASLAGLKFSFYKHSRGISLRISGYNDKQLLLLQELLTVIAEPDFDEQRFVNIRDNMIRELRNEEAMRPSQQVINDLLEAVSYEQWTDEELIAAMEGLDLGGLQAFAGKFWQSASAQAMIYGNYRPTAADELARQLESVLPASTPPELPDLRVLRLGAGESVLYPVEVEHDDAVLAWYLQGAGDSWTDRAATALTAQIIKSGFFQQLRTEQQLGYVVTSFNWPQSDVPGLVLFIQSPVADAATLASAMDQFMRGVPGDLDADQFARHRRALVNDILQPHENLWQRAEFYWQSIALERYGFDSREVLAEAVEALTLDDWRAYFDTVFLDQRHSLQVAAPGARKALPEGAYRMVESAAELKAGHDVFRVP